ncbi:MAG: glycosyltransferase [Acidobacteriota bacterium]|nr:glycosyltransferase [Acidobacteriota bacterium]
MTSAALTIAIPFYRGTDYLKLAIESVVAQEDPRWSLLVSDDGGRDQGVEDLTRSYASTAIAYHQNPETLGIAPNWNRCLDLAATELVTILHADDLLLPGYVGTMLALAGRYPDATALFCEAVIIDERGGKRFSFPDATKRLFRPPGDPVALAGEGGLRALMRGNFIMCPTLCYRRSALESRRFSESWRQCPDLELTTRLLMDGDTLVGSRHVGYAYRRHHAAVTALQTENLLRFEEEIELFDAVSDRAAGLGWKRAARTARRKLIVRLHLLYRVLLDVVRLRPRRAFEKLQFLMTR